MRVLLTGAHGQVGRAMQGCASAEHEVIAVGREEFDLADVQNLPSLLDRFSPDLVVNAAAYTNVDGAESEPELAFRINSTAVSAIARWCAIHACRLIHISTDFVFAGDQSTPYRESDRAEPLNVYGATKLQAEQSIAAVAGLNYFIVRTAWVYSAAGKNFVNTMLKLFESTDQVRVVVDQVGTPTSAASLARCLWKLVEDVGPSATLHYTDAGVASWYDFAVAIEEEARALGLLKKSPAIDPVASSAFPRPARRPANSVLDKSACWARTGLRPLHWRAELRNVLKDKVQ